MRVLILKEKKTAIALFRVFGLCFCFCLAICVSCSTANNDGTKLYPESFKIKTYRIDPVSVVENESLYGAYCLYYVDSDHLLLQYPQGVFFRSWNIKESRIDASFVRQGRGPGEFSSVGSPSIRIGSDNHIMLDMITPTSIATIDYNAVLSGSDDYIVGVIDRKNILDDGVVWWSFIIGETLLSEVEGDLDVYSFKRISINAGTILKTYHVIPLLGDDIMGKSYSNYNMIKPDDSKFVLLMYHFNKILIFDIASGDHICIEVRREEDAVYHYGTCSNKYIYAMYGRSKGHKEVQVFDWDGKFVKVIDTDCDLMDIAVNEDDSYLYALTEDNKLLTFNLK